MSAIIDFNTVMQAGAAVAGMYLMYQLANKMIDKIIPAIDNNTAALNSLKVYIEKCLPNITEKAENT